MRTPRDRRQLVNNTFKEKLFTRAEVLNNEVFGIFVPFNKSQFSIYYIIIFDEKGCLRDQITVVVGSKILTWEILFIGKE